jgi:hypothetical protein
MSYELKIKAKSLAAESRMIREEEIKLKRRARWHRENQQHEKAVEFDRIRKSLYEHRTEDVRFETRATNIARAFLSGKTRAEVEPGRRNRGAYYDGKLMGRAEKLVKKYGKGACVEEFRAWFTT